MSFTEYEQEFKRRLRVFLLQERVVLTPQDLVVPSLELLLRESLGTLYLSGKSIDSLEFLNWGKLMDPERINHDGRRAEEVILNPHALDLKTHLITLNGLGIPGQTIIEWINDVLREVRTPYQ